MDRFLAGLFLVCAIFANQLGHFWFTYGIWPRSWWAFAIFTMTSAVLAQMIRAFYDPKG